MRAHKSVHSLPGNSNLIGSKRPKKRAIDERTSDKDTEDHSATQDSHTAAEAALPHTRSMGHHARTSVRVEGVVQGVGFRPFVHSLAARLGLSGHVGNDAAGVFAEAEGAEADVAKFVCALTSEAPPLAIVDRVTATAVPLTGCSGFEILPSPQGGIATTLVSADSATCDDCLAELTDPRDRRFQYPFINCTNCGPRFTIVRDVPYDRPLTTMGTFTMCPECAAEYDDPRDRRFHAQPLCCPSCGPELQLGDRYGASAADEAIRLLRQGCVLAVKGLGGYHLAVDATNEKAVASLRNRKHREDKPFAIMVRDLADAHAVCTLDDAAEAALRDRRRQIVLLPRKPDAPVAPAIAPGIQNLGVMLPYTPLHHLLLNGAARPLVMTSANVSDEPIVYRDQDARSRLHGIADEFLTHNRPIHVRTDDSVVRIFRDRVRVQRRSRGYAPEPISVRQQFPRHVLACGAELKNTFCLAKNRHAFMSHHIGDLENYETMRSFTEGIAHFSRLFDIEPQVIVHDLHPEYLSTKYAIRHDGVDLLGVQHHHAHIASCLADNDEAGPVIGVAFDGTGYGTDHTIWGGEFLIADLTQFQRRGWLEPVPMPGGAAAIKQPWRMAAAYLGDEDLEVARRNESGWSAVVSMARCGTNSPLTSSAGRVFDAVAALLGVRDSVNYEGQAAVEMEQIADAAETGFYPASITGTEQLVVSSSDLILSCMDEFKSGVPREIIAARFHHSVAEAITRTCARLRSQTGIHTAALSGGVFQNQLLLNRTMDRLEAEGLRVLTHSRVPANDGGISLGQAVIAAAQDSLR